MNSFLFGAVYIIEPDYTREEIRRDLTYMKDSGYNLLTLWPVCNPWLAEDSHGWIFEETRYVLDECEKLGMKAILQLFGQNQAQEFMPDSALTSEMMVQDERGEHINENCFWANLNHPVVREYIDRYFKEAITEFREHPAVFGYDVFNEAHFRSDDPYTVCEYQKWLMKKYKTIENLNRLWYRRYESFAQIKPDKRRSAYSIWSSILPDLEYERFRSITLTDICQFLYDTAKKYDSDHPVIIDGTSAQIMSDQVILRNNDEFAVAKIPDMYGSTFYPKSWGKNYRSTPWTMSMYYSIPAGAARKAKKPYIVNELQTHTQSVLTPGSEVTPQELYNWIFMCMFTGSCGMQLWRWRPFLHGYQSTGRGLTSMDGIPNKRAERVKELVSLIRNQTDLFEQFQPIESGVKIAVSYGSRLYFDAFLKWNNSFWKENVEGWYRLFWDKGLNPEFTDLEDLQGEEAKVLILPSIISISEQTAENLEEYVKNGGILIADGRMGSVDEYGRVPAEGIPGARLSRLFGFRELDVDSGHSFTIDGADKDSQPIPCPYMEQTLDADSDTVVLARMEDQTPAVLLHSYGKGCTLYFNSFIGLELKKSVNQDLQNMVMSVISSRCSDLIMADKGQQVHMGLIRAEAAAAMLLINFSDQEETAEIRGLGTDRKLENLMTGECMTIENRTAENTVKLKLPANTAYIYKWQEV